MLCWCSFSECGMEQVACSIAYECGQYRIFEYLQPITTSITQDARPKIGDASLTISLTQEYPPYAIISSGIECGVLAAFLSSSYTFSFITTLFFNNPYKYIL